jgi:hypothetical protein
MPLPPDHRASLVQIGKSFSTGMICFSVIFKIAVFRYFYMRLYVGTGIYSTMKWAHQRHRRVTPLSLPLPWSRCMYELLCLGDSSSSELISYHVFDYYELLCLGDSSSSELISYDIFHYSVNSSFYFCHSILLSYWDSILLLVYIMLFYYITISI